MPNFNIDSCNKQIQEVEIFAATKIKTAEIGCDSKLSPTWPENLGKSFYWEK